MSAAAGRPRASDGRGVTGVALLGATGSIGETAQRVIARHPDRFRLVALTAHGNRAALAAAAERWRPALVGLVSPNGTPLPAGWRDGAAALVEAATHPDAAIVLNAVVGAAGLEATLAALGAGKRVALANKESLVMGGALVTAAAARGGGEVVPVDSEHSALLQCVADRVARPARHAAPGDAPGKAPGDVGAGLLPVTGVRRVVITASGGPFRTWPAERIAAAGVADALAHPTWQMGRKISVDSATLANKALEVVEAHVLFGIPYDRIEVVVHPQSIVHALVEFEDGSVIAQLGVPSMELPVLYALTWPDRAADGGVPRFDPVVASPLTFEPVRHDAFPLLALGVEAGRHAGAAPAVFNAANEAAVARFLEGGLPFAGIAAAVAAALERHADHPAGELAALVAADAAARTTVEEFR